MHHLLNEDQKQNWFSVCKDLQDQAENNKNFPCMNVKGDECWVYGLWSRLRGNEQMQNESQAMMENTTKWQ